ncbi:FecR domain-containing protein [Mucilaginibacter sp. RS28]|uniref:FecR domain-containing protein n=1 Tax=Mucilaginibacter straminoryzae TaxID=2932774 RepID=A0A9X1X1D9_9SPHI|nr:FecR family protein [Mucilaginibacter straminoryzae]MCJ8208836.1 FecR domain-containing protein [Mucilaginibacter straminoryzae]
MQRQKVLELISKYNNGTASEEEKGLIEAWYLQFEQQGLADIPDNEREADLNEIWARLSAQTRKSNPLTLWRKLSVAAAVLLFAAVGIYFFANHSNGDQQEVIAKIAQTTTPGGNKAILVLNNGERLSLTDAGNGIITTQGNVAVHKTASGQLSYQAQASTLQKAPVYNTMLTPAGGTYQLTLSDGTKVILDASSSIRYPVTFIGNERRVEISGQAYFEVAHNKTKPFRVVAGDQTVEVLGTHFNINAYKDERAVRTTLLEGSVKVSTAGQSAVIKPGEQAVLKAANHKIEVNQVDIETAVAWKNGYFRFKHANLQEVMQQFARWYNVDVKYEGNIPDVAITGKVLRAENASRMLEILSKLGIKMRMEGNAIVIQNN